MSDLCLITDDLAIDWDLLAQGLSDNAFLDASRRNCITGHDSPGPSFLGPTDKTHQNARFIGVDIDTVALELANTRPQSADTGIFDRPYIPEDPPAAQGGIPMTSAPIAGNLDIGTGSHFGDDQPRTGAINKAPANSPFYASPPAIGPDAIPGHANVASIFISNANSITVSQDSPNPALDLRDPTQAERACREKLGVHHHADGAMDRCVGAIDNAARHLEWSGFNDADIGVSLRECFVDGIDRGALGNMDIAAGRMEMCAAREAGYPVEPGEALVLGQTRQGTELMMIPK